MKVTFASRAWAQCLHWQEHDTVLLERLNRLIEECRRHPFKGTGRPEALGGDLAGFWSRRLTQEHRLVYRVVGKGEDERLDIAQCRYHY